MAWGDVDGDQDADLFVGSSAGWPSTLYLNHGTNGLLPSAQPAFYEHIESEDMGAVFLDVDQDGDLDLYVGSGSVECEPGDIQLTDRLYLNDGSGEFTDATSSWLPDLRISTGPVAPADYDRDGDLDLFIGGRSVPGAYPTAPQHALLENRGDHYVNVLNDQTPALKDAGMVVAALWTYSDQDEWPDLMLATDWGPIRLFINNRGQLEEKTVEAGLSEELGWWSSLISGDFDADGDLDYIAGNTGLNSKYHPSKKKPAMIYYGDFGDGNMRIVEAKKGSTPDSLLPVRGKSCSSQSHAFCGREVQDL